MTPVLFSDPFKLVWTMVAVDLFSVPLLLKIWPATPLLFCRGVRSEPARFQVPALLTTPPPLKFRWPTPVMFTVPPTELFQTLMRVTAPVKLVVPVVVRVPLPVRLPAEKA